MNAIDLFDETEVKFPADFYDESQEITILFKYKLEDSDISEVNTTLHDKHGFPKESLKRFKISDVLVFSYFDAASSSKVTRTEVVNFHGNEEFKGYVDIDGKAIKRTKEHDHLSDIKLSDFFASHLSQYFYPKTHKTTLWKPSAKYLMLDEINLSEFSEKLGESSTPLYNAFKLAGFKSDSDIQNVIKRLDSASRVNDLESRLSTAVTNHIRRIWLNHAVNIIFEIHNNKISFLVEDEGVLHKSKTTSQRSDGFKQFLSFLLTISAQNTSDQLTDHIIIIDEPETHLHPQAQLNLLDELLSLSNYENGNIVIYATHSPFMIDHKRLHRNIRVHKEANEITKLTSLSEGESSYAEINYTVFDVPTTDYHNELYGYCEVNHPMELTTLKKDRTWYNLKSGKSELVSLCTYIRHSIHHPENTKNKRYTNAQLIKSIEIMRRIKYGKK